MLNFQIKQSNYKRKSSKILFFGFKILILTLLESLHFISNFLMYENYNCIFSVIIKF